jgi:hypothetical protein
LMIWAICIVWNTCIICMIRTISNIVTSIPQVDEWCIKKYDWNIDVPSNGVKCMYSISWPFKWKNAFFLQICTIHTYACAM